MKTLILTVFSCLTAVGVFAQDTEPSMERLSALEGKVTGLEESYLETKATVDKLAKLKISGYLQAQYRSAMDGEAAQTDTNDVYTGVYNYAVGNYAGGTFAGNTDGLFQVRRGRFKLNYNTKYTDYVVQLDVTQSGVGVKDAYLSLTEPWLAVFKAKMGVFDRPFGFEISYSSSSRESPERSRLFQTLFPGERDLGAQLEAALPEKYGPLSWLNFKGGLFTGNGIAVESDQNLDLMGRLGISIPLTDLNLAIDGGVSAYIGSVSCTDTSWVSFDTTVSPKKVFKRGKVYEMNADKKQFVQDTSKSQLLKDFDRKYTGMDLQVYSDVLSSLLPVSAGLSVRGEYIFGLQPGTSSSSSFYNAAKGASALYLRDFSGYYLTYVQNIGNSIQTVVKYDLYDPNTGIEAGDIDSAGIKKGKLSPADLAYTTLGLGLIYHWDENLKFVLYLDKVGNETLEASEVKKLPLSDQNSLRWYTEDLKDDVLTFRVQYKF